MNLEQQCDSSSLLCVITFFCYLKLGIKLSFLTKLICVYNVMGILQLLSLLVLNCACPMLYSDSALCAPPPFP
jgi:hypothetical protein